MRLWLVCEGKGPETEIMAVFEIAYYIMLTYQ